MLLSYNRVDNTCYFLTIVWTIHATFLQSCEQYMLLSYNRVDNTCYFLTIVWTIHATFLQSCGQYMLLSYNRVNNTCCFLTIVWTIPQICYWEAQYLICFYRHVGYQINTTGVTSGAGTANPSGAPEFTPGFQWGSCYSIFSFTCLFLVFKRIPNPFGRHLGFLCLFGKVHLLFLVGLQSKQSSAISQLTVVQLLLPICTWCDPVVL